MKIALKSFAFPTFLILFAMVCMAGFIGCRKNSLEKIDSESEIETDFSIPENSLPYQEESPKKNESTGKTDAEEVEFNGRIDYDLSAMNANMVYAQIFNMMIDPESFENKFLKIKGNFTMYENGPEGKPSYAVIVADALACCQQGIDFKYDFGGKIPEDYSEITLIGKYVLTELSSGISYNFIKAISVE